MELKLQSPEDRNNAQDQEAFMIFVKIDDLKPGMILAQPVKTHQGILLLEAGVKISKKNIRIFKSWGINEISVKGDLAESTGESKPSVAVVKESVEMELEEQFRDVLDDPVMVEIFRAAGNQLTKKIRSNESENENF
ncbi:MAG: hypothetical protein KJO34_00310 [Deltaproteobacteria bacterium]|nr:hypothetical protein [Deltaproteobacteria bacterium]